MRLASVLHEFVAHLGLERLVPPAAIEDFLARRERGENHTTNAETQTEADATAARADDPEAAAHACGTHRELVELRHQVVSLTAAVKTLQLDQEAVARPEPETGGLEHDVAELRAGLASTQAYVTDIRATLEALKRETPLPTPVYVFDSNPRSGRSHLEKPKPASFPNYRCQTKERDQYKEHVRRMVIEGVEYVVTTHEGYDYVWAYNMSHVGRLVGDMFILESDPALGCMSYLYTNFKSGGGDTAKMVGPVDTLKKEFPEYYLEAKRRGWIPDELL